MGDRAQIVLKNNDQSESSIYLYTHWNGYELPEILRQALIRGEGRWDDDPYLSRIIFCEIIKDDVLGTTGAGISLEYQDSSSDRDITVFLAHQEIKVGNNPIIFSFAEYVSIPRKW